MASFSSIQNSVNLIKDYLDNPDSVDSTYFYRLNQLRLDYGIYSIWYYNNICVIAHGLHIRAKKIQNQEIYYNSYPVGYNKMLNYAKKYFASLDDLNFCLKNLKANDFNAYNSLKGKVQKYFKSVITFAEQFAHMKGQYEQYISTLPKEG